MRTAGQLYLQKNKGEQTLCVSATTILCGLAENPTRGWVGGGAKVFGGMTKTRFWDKTFDTPSTVAIKLLKSCDMAKNVCYAR
jgi:hypothetical protein